MNLIERVAKVIRDSFNSNDIDCYPIAKAAISAIPSIKWQKIETLPDEYKDGFKVFLAWDTVINQPQTCIWVGSWKYQPKYYSHWAEINAPEGE